MTRFFVFLTLLFCLPILGLLSANSMFPHGPTVEDRLTEEEDRKELWKQVEEAMQKGLPKTAQKKIQTILDDAIEQKDYPDAIRATCFRAMIESQVQGAKPAFMIRQLEEAIENRPEEMRPMLQAVLAQTMYSYYQQNRWRFSNRTKTAAAPSDDFETWDLPRLLDYVDEKFTAALSHEELKRIPIKDYDRLLVTGTIPDSYRPTLYDFIANQALEFYALDEQIVRPQSSFVLSADSPILSNAESFLDWEIDEEYHEAPLVKAVHLYQDLLKLHAEDEDRSAWLDSNLLRLRFGNRQASGSEKNARYKAALRRFADEHAEHELSSLALGYLATQMVSDNEQVEAFEIATTGKNRFPDSFGGKHCHNVIEGIIAKSSTVVTEQIWNEADPEIKVTYKNFNKIYFRLVKFDFESLMKTVNYGGPENMDHAQRERYMRRRPTKSWSADLPETKDYRQRIETVKAEIDVPPGGYFLISSHKPGFIDAAENIVSFTSVWVTDMTVVQRNQNNSIHVQGQLLNALSGLPIDKATIKGWSYDNRKNKYVEVGSTTSDSNGLFSIKGRNQSYSIYLVKHGDQQLGVTDQIYRYSNNNRERETRSTVFFTDRAIYRPGQTVQFKGIALRSHRGTNDYKILPNEKVVVGFYDNNGQEVEQREFASNQYGSFSGSFTAPRGNLTGLMSLRVIKGPGGSASFRVEEYKRPKFYVELESPKEAARLNTDVEVGGKATSYTGAPIDGAKLTYRVVRNVRYPTWWYWRYWRPYPRGDAQEIANGITKTEVDGSFKISFKAIPDPKVERESEPTFQYTIEVAVTDSTGETRTDQHTVNVGYTALAATMGVDNWLVEDEAVEFKIGTRTLDGEPQSASGTLKVYKLKEPDQVTRAKIANPYYGWYNITDNEPDLSDIKTWSTSDVVHEAEVETDESGEAVPSASLDAGAYKAIFETKDKYGTRVTAEYPFMVLAPSADKFSIKVPDIFRIKKTTLEPGDEFEAVWGTGYKSGRAYVEIEHRGKILKSYWTDAGKTQHVISQNVTEEMRGGFTVRVTHVQENRAYLHSQRINVPWSNKALKIKWERFVSKLKPGTEETWTAVVSGPDAEKVSAEFVAGLYDASLDAFMNHSWMSAFNVFYRDYSRIGLSSANRMKNLQSYWHNLSSNYQHYQMTYRQYAHGIVLFGYWYAGGRAAGFNRRSLQKNAEAAPAAADSAVAGGEADMQESESLALESRSNATLGDDSKSKSTPDLESVEVRKNLQETAFFFPHLVADEDGSVRMSFTMPEALTKWKFLGFAHDEDLRAGLLSDEIVTAKDLMVQPNPPRFLREGDSIEFSVKVTNQSTHPQEGTARLAFKDARTNESVDSLLENIDTEQDFTIPPNQSISLFWKIQVPDYSGILTYTAVGATEKLSDGEEGYLPVLSKRILVTESLPLPIRGEETKTFDFEQLKKLGDSKTMQPQTYTVQMTSNPMWYAVMALPYLMEYPHQCNEQVFNRYYANALATHIANSDPKIKRTFDQWRGTDALDSPLEKNQDLKNTVLENTPWLRDAKDESQSRRDVAILFDENRLKDELDRALNQLKEAQYDNGSWSWFPGGRSNDYITLYITTGFARLRHLKVETDIAPAIKALPYLDNWMNEYYQRLLRSGADMEKIPPSYMVCFYLYMRTFFIEEQPIADQHKTAFNYFVRQSEKLWLKTDSRLTQGYLAIALNRLRKSTAAKAIMASLSERAIDDEEMGKFWREGEYSWYWYRAPIETQSLLIEAYDEVVNDATAVEDCKVWLLKQKQTQNWKSTKATADAVYALLIRGADRLASDKLVEVSLGGDAIQPDSVEAGTGFFEQKFVRAEIKPEMGDITLKKSDPGVAWGSVHFQYLEDIAKIEPYEGTPLTLKKGLFIKKNTAAGPELTAVDGPVNVGDELVTRIELRVDRAMEYVHLKDYRGSGTEPVNVLSQYKVQDGLWYYESTRDAASHFFIDYLPPGTYVFEYSVRVQLRGEYQTGIAQIQCMYAPEFNSHSGSVGIVVE